MPDLRLEGRTALITGGGRGIGAAVARAFAAEGARVFLVARTAAELESTAGAIRSAGGVAGYRAADASSASEVRAAVEACESELGPIDTLVTAAGVYGPIGLSWEVDVDAWARAVDVNLMGTLHACRAVIPGMVERGAGSIITFSGGGATSPLPRFSAYAATKAAVVRLAETLAEELSGTGVRVNAIAPGAVDTRLQDDVLEAGERAGDLHGRMRRLRERGEGATPAEVPAALAVFLAAAASEGLTGKLVSAPHDGWADWDADRIASLMDRPWLTLRRMDAYTLRPFVRDLSAAG